MDIQREPDTQEIESAFSGGLPCPNPVHDAFAYVPSEELPGVSRRKHPLKHGLSNPMPNKDDLKEPHFKNKYMRPGGYTDLDPDGL